LKIYVFKLHKINWRKIIGSILLITLVLSIIFAIIQIITSPATVPEGQEYVRLKSDYVLMLLQCVLGLIVMAVP